MANKLCEVCREGPVTGLLFCRPCQRSYDRFVGKEGTTAALIQWTAERARKFERKRQNDTDDKLNKVLVEFAKYRAG